MDSGASTKTFEVFFLKTAALEKNEAEEQSCNSLDWNIYPSAMGKSKAHRKQNCDKHDDVSLCVETDTKRKWKSEDQFFERSKKGECGKE